MYSSWLLGPALEDSSLKSKVPTSKCSTKESWGKDLSQTKSCKKQPQFIYTRIKVDGTVTMYSGLYKPRTNLPFGDCAIYHGVDARGCTSSGIHGRWQEIPVVESPSFRDLAVSACHFFVWDTGKAEIKYPKWETLWVQSFKLGLSVESWIIQMWIHDFLWCNFSFLKTNDMNILDGKTLTKLRDFCQPGILQLSWRSKMRSKWRPQWFAANAGKQSLGICM